MTFPKSDLPKDTTCERAPGAGGQTYDICTAPNGDKYLCDRQKDVCERWLYVQMPESSYYDNRVLATLSLVLAFSLVVISIIGFKKQMSYIID
jgi:hypothetical protein